MEILLCTNPGSFLDPDIVKWLSSASTPKKWSSHAWSSDYSWLRRESVSMKCLMQVWSSDRSIPRSFLKGCLDFFMHNGTQEAFTHQVWI
jgi:hypothetical protein